MSTKARGRTITLSAPVQPDSLSVVHDALMELWAMAPTSGDLKRHAFNTAVIEILGDIIRHSESADFQLRLSLSPSEAVAEFEDRGIALPEDLATIIGRQVNDMAERGRGLRLAHAASDQLSYRRQADTNHWIVRCRLSP